MSDTLGAASTTRDVDKGPSDVAITVNETGVLFDVVRAIELGVLKLIDDSSKASPLPPLVKNIRDKFETVRETTYTAMVNAKEVIGEVSIDAFKNVSEKAKVVSAFLKAKVDDAEGSIDKIDLDALSAAVD